MEIQKPSFSEIKRVQRLIELDEDLTDREIWIYREYF